MAREDAVIVKIGLLVLLGIAIAYYSINTVGLKNNIGLYNVIVEVDLYSFNASISCIITSK